MHARAVWHARCPGLRRPRSPQRRLPPRRAALPGARWFLPVLAVAAVALIAVLWSLQPRGLSEKDVQALIKYTLETTPPPPTARDAYEKILPSVVAVRSMADDGEEGTKGMETGKAGLAARHRRHHRR